MTYTKPEISNLGNAVAVIHGVKLMVTGLDGIQPSNPHAFQAAYDLDE